MQPDPTKSGRVSPHKVKSVAQSRALLIGGAQESPVVHTPVRLNDPQVSRGAARLGDFA